MRVALSLIAAILLAACSATVRVAEAQQSQKDVNPFSKFAPFLSQFNEELLLPMRQNCKNPPVKLGFPTCEIEVEIWLVNSGGIDYCLTQFPKETEFDRLTRVVWKLKKHVLISPVTGRTYNISFHADHGIIAYRDRFKQIIAGGIGDGVTPDNKWWFHRFNWHTKLDPAIVYVPLILQTLSSDENDVGVCAVGDPRMINE